MRLMSDNDVINELNKNKTLDQIALEGDATDIKLTINTTGEYTFAKDNIDRDWYSLLISATDENGTNVTIIIFHSHLENFNWSVETSTFPQISDVAKAKGSSKGIFLGSKEYKQLSAFNPTQTKNIIGIKSLKKK